MIAFLLASTISLSQVDEIRHEIRPFLDALAIVESNNNDKAVGDNGKAIGRYQIWQVYWKDALKHAPELGGKYGKVRGKVYAERVLVAYLHRYAPKALAKGDYKTLARIHNGGPRGSRRRATLPYWNRVNSHLALCEFCGKMELVK